MDKLTLIFQKIGIVIILLLLSGVNFTYASETNGSVISPNKYAWGENIGWINFGCTNCNVSVTDASINGYGWSSQYGWINFNPTHGGVLNNSEGNLSGYAWGENIGWINFGGVTINSQGDFLGYATVKSDNSKISFNCTNTNSCGTSDFKVATDWRALSVRGTGGGGGNNGGNGGGGVVSGGGGGHPIIVSTSTSNQPSNTNNPNTGEIVVNNISQFVNSVIDLFKPSVIPVVINTPKVSKVAPLSLKTRWNILPVKEIKAFVFAPLPREVRALAQKFPQIGRTLQDVGVNRFSDVDKLTGVDLNIPGLATTLDNTIKTVGIEKLKDIDRINNVAISVPGFSKDSNGKLSVGVGAGKIALIKGLPIADFPLVAKNNLPTEYVFARADHELVDLGVTMSLNTKGQVTQNMNSLPGSNLRLVVKPISKPKSVTGYFAFKAATPSIPTVSVIPRSSLTASAIFAMDTVQDVNPQPISVENKLILSSFEYKDVNHDGIYIADVTTPSVPGEYEVITIIDYIDPSLGTRQMRMTTVVDPEGYVFEKNDGKETRIPSAIVSLYHLNNGTKKYELWPSKDYQQENPQVTDIRGTYSFLVPEGSYYLQVEAPGYKSYYGKVFVVSEGNGIHQNIELSSSQSWLSSFDWKTTLLIVIILLLVYNLYHGKISGYKFLNKNGK